MYAVERLSSYISRGVYTVSGPFHPFGGAVDIIVVEQQDGSFKSSPWYVRFGKFQGVLKTREKVVNISVNGVEANFHMYLDHKGKPSFSRRWMSKKGIHVDEESNDRRPMKSKSCNFDANGQKPVAPIDLSTGKIVPRTTSRRGRFWGFFREKESGADVTRVSSLERAEIAANLLEVRWTTSLATKKPKKDKASQISGEDRLDTEADNDGKSQTALCVNEDMENGSNPSQLQEENGFCDGEMSNNSQSGFHNSECSVGETGLEMSCLGTPVETSSLNETDLGETQELSEILRVINEVSVGDADHHDNVKSVTSSITGSESQIPQTAELEVSPCKQFNEEEAFDERDAVLSGHDVLEEENEQDGVQSFIYCETSGSSTVGLDDSIKETQEILYLACGGSGEVHVHDKTLHETSELISEVLEIIHQDTVTERLAEDIKSEAKKVPENHSQHGSPSYSCMPANGEAGLEEPLVMQESYTEMVRVDNSVEKPCHMAVSPFPVSVIQVINELQRSLESIGDSQEFDGDYVPTKVIRISPPESSDDEQFPFSDLDDFKHSEVRSLDLISLDPVEKENRPSLKLDSNEAVEDLFDANYVSYSSPDSSVQENPPNDLDNLIDKSRVVSSSISIPSSIKVTCEEVERLAESLPNMGPLGDDLDAHKLHHPISLSLDSNSKSLGWALLRNNISTLTKLNADNKHILVQEQPSLEDTQISRELINVLADPAVEISLCKHLLYEGMGLLLLLRPLMLRNWIWINLPLWVLIGHYFPWDAAAPIVLGMLSLGKEQILELKGMIAVDQVEKTLEGDPAKAIVASGGSWRLWPFRRSRAISSVQPKVRVITPTFEQLASLNLKEGRNTITFTFSTTMLGEQQVDARIYLWKWNSRIVISDVDGTITKSDVLGQFMPMVGVDWSQTGVAHLFSAIKENGYQLLFLSARAISQAYHTRQFLFNLKQDGKALPDGPVVISPDGLFPSLFREVIRRAPHEFKIACLEDIKALFPSDCNPFYAGFGNRDTDEFSYLKVGIPKGKIFIINPKGEVAVNHRVDTKSYTSLHTLVNGMFPSTSSSEQEDFNSWNYWRLPPPIVDI
ncbi:hypothetical protein AAG906_029829 [Vitis piasezkii]